MNNEKWVLGLIAVVALWWFWMHQKMTSSAVQSSCGCQNTKTAVSSTSGINPTAGAGSTALLSGKPSVQPVQGTLTPKPAPGNTLAPMTPLTPVQAPFQPFIPVGSTVWMANTTPRAVRG